MNYDESIIALLQKSEELKIQGQSDEAIKIINKIIVEEPGCFEAFEELGDNYLSIREVKKAEKALRQAINVNPKSSNAHYLLGFLYSLEQKWKESVNELSEADVIMPNHPEILRCLGWSYYNLNRRSQQGVAILERSKNLCPDDPNILCDLGVCYMNSEYFLKAIPLFKRVIELAPDSDQARECKLFLKILKNPNYKPD
jgi:tetratricopeptide (TPR) repeat protein